MGYFIEHREGTQDYRLWHRSVWVPFPSWEKHEEKYSLRASLKYDKGKGNWKVIPYHKKTQEHPAETIVTVIEGELTPIHSIEGGRLIEMMGEKPSNVLQRIEQYLEKSHIANLAELARFVNQTIAESEIIRLALARGDLDRKDYFVGQFVHEFTAALMDGAGRDMGEYFAALDHYRPEACARAANLFRITPEEAEEMHRMYGQSGNRDRKYPQLALPLVFKTKAGPKKRIAVSIPHR